jgi:hypothetical protein
MIHEPYALPHETHRLARERWQQFRQEQGKSPDAAAAQKSTGHTQNRGLEKNEDQSL